MHGQETVKPATPQQICEVIAQAIADSAAIETRGGGSKRSIGAPGREAICLDMSGFDAVIDYDPPELVLTAGAGTPLSKIEDLVAGKNQMLAFDPYDHGPIFGRPAGAATIGGIIAAGVSGSRRLSAGGVRDHLLGFRAVSGRAEIFVGGAKVVKNVTGFDLPKLMAGSWGRLAVLTEVTLKVLPRPRSTATIVVHGLGDEAAIRAMSAAMGSQAEIAAAAHLPDAALTALRIEGFPPSVAARSAMLQSLLKSLGPVDILDQEAGAHIWGQLRDLSLLPGDVPLWRISAPPTSGAAVTAALRGQGARWCYDWAGGLVWLTLPAGADQALVREAAEQAGGHAMLVRADDALRARLPALHPEPPVVAALSRRIKTAFDPSGVLDPHRLGTG